MGRREQRPGQRPVPESGPQKLHNVPTLSITSTLERQLTRQCADLFRQMDSMTAEYDDLITSQDLSFADVALYVKAAGEFDKFTALVASLAQQVRVYEDRELQNAMSSRKPMNINKLIGVTNRLSLQLTQNGRVNKDNRPFLMAVFADVFYVSRYINDLQTNDKLRARGNVNPEEMGLYSQMTTTQTLSTEGSSPEAVYLREFCTLIGLSDLKKKDSNGDFSAQKEQSDAYRTDGDSRMLALQGLPLDPFDTTVEVDAAPIKKIRLFRSANDDIATMGTVQLDIGMSVVGPNVPGYQKNIPTPLTFSVSRITGDLALLGSAGISPEFLFKKYGIEKLYPFIRAVTLQALENSILSGKVSISTDPFQTKFTLQAEQNRAEDATVVTPVETVPEPLQEADNRDESELTQDRNAATRLRTIHYRKAKSALVRMGVEFQDGGRHIKAIYQGRTAAFPNSHSGKNANIIYVLRSVLKVLGISEQDFISNL